MAPRAASSAGSFLGPGSSAIGCNSSKNLGEGIISNVGGTIQDCTLFQNVGNGIQITSGCKVIGNNCRENGFGAGSGAGIFAGNANGPGGNRIEGNNCSDADFGIRVTSFHNFIVRNICSGSTTGNWVLVANNYYGTIVNLTAVVPLAVNGNSAANALNTNTEANANFTQ
jgi:hypothetical protein